MPVQINLGKVQTSKSDVTKCSHCQRMMSLRNLQTHLQEVQRIKKQEEERKKAENVLKKQKDLRAVIEQKQKEKDLRNKIEKLEKKRQEEARNKQKMNAALRQHYIRTLRSDCK